MIQITVGLIQITMKPQTLENNETPSLLKVLKRRKPYKPRIVYRAKLYFRNE
jgi:hypothetical protein